MERHREFASVLDEVAEATETFVAGRDLIVTLPTGYGKSIIYAILPTLNDKIRGI